ncbi:hypothetical protein AOQ88_00480 [Candidatus Riesia sp. GBBU]|nr:hypothetical protein AOQ88_00480 [Candidatus Riesia sp. GBBU]
MDTIAARATPYGTGGISVIRISGKKVKKISKEILKISLLPRYANYLNFYDEKGKIIDQGIAIYFKSPKSFTGEDILELHGHGGKAVTNTLLQRVLKIKGVRLAFPGEFSKRAYINRKLNLLQAESIYDLIYSDNRMSSYMAINSLNGALSKRIFKIVERIDVLRKKIEFYINFPDDESENEEFVFSEKKELDSIIRDINLILSDARKGNILKHGINIAIVGSPNSGKSSLLNMLSGEQISIVTNIPGTTRDILRSSIKIGENTLHISDTAGLRESEDIIEKIGIDLTWNEIEKSNHIIYMIDGSKTNFKSKINKIFLKRISKIFKSENITILKNKIDITGEKEGEEFYKNYCVIRVSVLKKTGIDLLKGRLKKIFFPSQNNEEDIFYARKRHIRSLKESLFILKNISENIEYIEIDIIAEKLRDSRNNLNEIMFSSSEELLNQIFSEFCIGK